MDYNRRTPGFSDTTSQLKQLFARVAQEMHETRPENPIHFFADFLCRHYPEHLHGFADLWNDDPECLFERELVIDFFRYNKIPQEVCNSFLAKGYDTLEAICAIDHETIKSIMKESSWLPGHRVRINSLFQNIESVVKSFRHDRENHFQTLQQQVAKSEAPPPTANIPTQFHAVTESPAINENAFPSSSQPSNSQPSHPYDYVSANFQ